MGSDDHPGKMDEKLKSENMQKRAVFCEKFSSPQAARGIDPLTKILRTFKFSIGSSVFAGFTSVRNRVQAHLIEASPGPPLACISPLL